MRVSGCDLVYPLPSSIQTGPTDEFLFSLIPANPAYWTGTRIAQIAPSYMNYRPIKLTFHYIPQVAVTQAGSVIFGTLWNGAAPSDDIQQALNTSNGGGIINCYVPASTQISLGSNLQQNLFTLNGDINPDTSPFLFAAIARGCVGADPDVSIVPGYFMVDYVYDFKNAMGQTWIFDRSLATTTPITTWSLPNRSLVLLQGIDGFGPGTVFDAETIDGQTSYFYRGTQVTIPDSTWVQVFENGQTASLQALSRELRASRLASRVASATSAWVYVPPSQLIPDGAQRMVYLSADGSRYQSTTDVSSFVAQPRWYTDSSVTPQDFFNHSGALLWSVTGVHAISSSIISFELADIPARE